MTEPLTAKGGRPAGNSRRTAAKCKLRATTRGTNPKIGVRYLDPQAALYPTLVAEAKAKHQALTAADETRDTQEATISDAMLALAEDRAAIARAQRRLKAQLELTFEQPEKVYSFFDFAVARGNKPKKPADSALTQA